MSEQIVMKNYEELEFRDDFMFGKIMENSQLCREVLECLLQRPVGELQEPVLQKEFRFTSDGKPIRLDIYNKDNNSNVYDAEMENLNNHSVEWHALPKRSRFYQSSIDVDFLSKKGHYKDLPESYVMFICTFDPFGLGLSQYTFRERCNEKSELLLCDGTEKHFYNCCYEGDDLTDDLKAFYEYVRSGKAGSSLTKKIDEAVGESRKNEVWRTQYMKERIIIMDAIRESEERAKKANEEKEKALKELEELKKEIEGLKKESERLEKEKALKENEYLKKEIERLKALVNA